MTSSLACFSISSAGSPPPIDLKKNHGIRLSSRILPPSALGLRCWFRPEKEAFQSAGLFESHFDPGPLFSLTLLPRNHCGSPLRNRRVQFRNRHVRIRSMIFRGVGFFLCARLRSLFKPVRTLDPAYPSLSLEPLLSCLSNLRLSPGFLGFVSGGT